MKLLDTNICSAIIKHDANALKYFSNSQRSEIYIPTIVRAELHYGAFNGAKIERSLKDINALLAPLQDAPFSLDAARVYGQLRAELRKKGKPIGPNDLIIAATAIAHGFALVTNNTREFSQVEGLRLEDWLS